MITPATVRSRLATAPLALPVLCWLLGIMLENRLHVALAPLLLVGVTAAVLALVWRATWSAHVLLCLAMLLLGAGHLALAQPGPAADDVAALTGQQVVLRGTVEGQPDRRDDGQSATLSALVLVAHGRAEMRQGRVLLQLPPQPELAYGAQVTVSGLLSHPHTSATFDYGAYLQRQGIGAVMKNPELTIHPGFGGSALLRPLGQLNDAVRATPLRLLPEPHAALLNGILLGVKSTLPKAVLRDFMATGTAHILVVSGWNITVVVFNAVTLLIVLGLSRRPANVVALGILVLYVLFVGGTPSVLRAAVMASLVIFADSIGRPAAAWNLLAIACAVLTLIDPLTLWDIGFQLSALAAAGIFALTPGLTEWLEAVPLVGRHRLIVEPIAATLGASALTLPIMFTGFGQLSPIAPLANLVLLPAVPWAMGFGALAIGLASIVPPLAQAVAFLSWPFLEWLLWGAHFLAGLPGATITPPAGQGGWVPIYYVLLALLWSRLQRRPAAAPATVAALPSP